MESCWSPLSIYIIYFLRGCGLEKWQARVEDHHFNQLKSDVIHKNSVCLLITLSCWSKIDCLAWFWLGNILRNPGFALEKQFSNWMTRLRFISFDTSLSSFRVLVWLDVFIEKIYAKLSGSVNGFNLSPLRSPGTQKLRIIQNISMKENKKWLVYLAKSYLVSRKKYVFCTDELPSNDCRQTIKTHFISSRFFDEHNEISFVQFF